ncbi:pyrroline-5-carboxylate reductase [Alicyclobacillus fastidiosus]|uniref:Pyrroline-5-carboxylate reductase n=1 Tax=Alicyclobacillus fastidiosus TaxID=392011 RepID=A0ABY6ZFJ3_9BACL|nr:pyrroline-5-carboxylate reductase [Alicyclobacillus fastidiosus]WAH40986.1 pyrroline-5-carboxylate reductase [Alicyclobacillus fastidiosus]GMA62500.1 pyrroline-5-carboxylate reductase [Alicyclobacillus fastidiosus]
MNKLTKVRVLFIGAGRMARAMVSGMVRQQGTIDWEVHVANRSNSDRLAELVRAFDVKAVRDWRTSAQQADVIVLAMPPDEHHKVLAGLWSIIRPEQLVASVAAGIGLSGLEAALPQGAQCAWMMPNTAAGIGESMTLCAIGDFVTERNRHRLDEILGGLGRSFICTEQQVHDLTAITGSAPAFAFQFAKALEDSATQFGVDPHDARNLVGQMMLGAAKLMLTGQEPLALAAEVTTPGGATAAGLAVLEQTHFAKHLQAAVDATNSRARALSPKSAENA